MFENEDSDNEIVNSVVLFEEMIAGQSFTFFDVEDFEKIIDYYIEIDFKDKANIALDWAMKQFPNDLTLTLIKVDFLNSDQKFRLHKLIRMFHQINIFPIFLISHPSLYQTLCR